MKLSLPAAKTWHTGWMGYPGHRGQDFGWGDGDQVLAAAPGTIVEVYAGGGYNGGWGNRVVIEHAPGVNTTYNHLATGTIAVTVDQTVARGQLLARMGATGNVTGKHLHFELELGGRGPAFRVDPAPFFTKDLPGTSGDTTPASGQEEDEDMAKNSALAYKRQADGKEVVLVGNSGSGFELEYVSATGKFDSDLNNAISRTFDTGPFAVVPEYVAGAFKRSLAQVREALAGRK